MASDGTWPEMSHFKKKKKIKTGNNWIYLYNGVLIVKTILYCQHSRHDKVVQQPSSYGHFILVVLMWIMNDTVICSVYRYTYLRETGTCFVLFLPCFFFWGGGFFFQVCKEPGSLTLFYMSIVSQRRALCLYLHCFSVVWCQETCAKYIHNVETVFAFFHEFAHHVIQPFIHSSLLSTEHVLTLPPWLFSCPRILSDRSALWLLLGSCHRVFFSIGEYSSYW